MANIKQAIPAFCRGTQEALLAAISEGGRFYPLQRIVWCWIKSGERAGQLALVTPGVNEGDPPVVEYMGGGALPCIKIVDELPEAEDAVQDVLYIVNKHGYIFDGEDFVMVIGGEGGGDASSELLDNLVVTAPVGGIPSGKRYVAGTPLEKVLRDMLNPVVYPTLTNPSATLVATGSKLLESGSTFETVMTVEFNRGEISPAYGTSGYRSGDAIAYKLNDIEQTSNIFNVTVTPQDFTFGATVSYAEGEQPLDSEGKNYDYPLPEGEVATGTIEYEFVDALYANTVSIDTVSKLALISKSAKSKVLSFPESPENYPEIFDVPASWEIVSIQVKNGLTDDYDDCTEEFSTSTVSHMDAGGNSVDYVRYTNNLGYDIGSREIKITWK